ncbi:hypothetical protein [Streptacidiphilus neutrinimicus]|uniref:hypothetical protein n=1 Tax=Streptacidiphilus neutrinimicus TaxID=105420 RepID=UPI000ACAC4C5|nr:hypothetical protein [Streptacidiphilus neutrinimicus]
MTDDEELSPTELVGKQLLHVTTSWHHYPGHQPSLLHLWLHLESLGPVQIHTPGTGLLLQKDQPHEPYSMDEYGYVTVTDGPPDVPVAQFVGQRIRSVREIRYKDSHVDFAAGLTLQFPARSIRLLALDDELVIASDQHLGTVEAYLHEDVVLARVVQTSASHPSQWNAWTTSGQYLYLRYRHGEGSVEQHPSQDVETWDGEDSRLWTLWDDGTGSGIIELAAFLTMAGLQLAPNADV